MKIFLFLVSLLLLSVNTTFGANLNFMFTDHMVIQRDRAIKIYGEGKDGETVQVEFAGQKGNAVVKDGKWKILLQAMKAGGPYKLSFKSGEQGVTLTDILLGDVWLLGGQSNMQTEIGIYYWNKAKVFPFFSNAIAESYVYANSNVRMWREATSIQEDRTNRVVYNNTYGSNWLEMNPSNAYFISATGYYFGKKLQEGSGVPIGLVMACVGGTPVEAWVPKEVLTTNAAFSDVVAGYQKALDDLPKNTETWVLAMSKWSNDVLSNKALTAPRGPMGPKNQRRPNALFNGMIAPLVDLELKGAIWYQAEDNCRNYSNTQLYTPLFKALIENWRYEFNNPQLAFYFCQLAANGRKSPVPEDPVWSYMREAQEAALSLPYTGMANLIDGGLETDIHPPYKAISGGRLADLVLRDLYSKEGVACGPRFKSIDLKGDKANLNFSDIGGGLVVKEVTLGYSNYLPSTELRGFAVADESEKFVWAKAELSGNKVIVTHPEGKDIKYVRYAWANFPLANLYNKEGYPTYPFRTDRLIPAK